MTFDECQQAAARTINPELTKGEALMHGLLGLSAEAGEVCGLHQKRYQGHIVDHGHIVKELGDCLWMIAEICTALDIDMGSVATANIVKLKERYPDGFSAEKSLHRRDGDV